MPRFIIIIIIIISFFIFAAAAIRNYPQDGDTDHFGSIICNSNLMIFLLLLFELVLHVFTNYPIWPWD